MTIIIVNCELITYNWLFWCDKQSANWYDDEFDNSWLLRVWTASNLTTNRPIGLTTSLTTDRFVYDPLWAVMISSYYKHGIFISMSTTLIVIKLITSLLSFDFDILLFAILPACNCFSSEFEGFDSLKFLRSHSRTDFYSKSSNTFYCFGAKFPERLVGLVPYFSVPTVNRCDRRCMLSLTDPYSMDAMY